MLTLQLMLTLERRLGMYLPDWLVCQMKRDIVWA